MFGEAKKMRVPFEEVRYRNVPIEQMFQRTN